MCKELDRLVTVLQALQEFHCKLEANSRKPEMRQFFHALKEGDREDEELKSILSQLRAAQDKLAIRIQIINVGLTGSQRDGFRVAVGILRRVDANVIKVLGEGLRIARVLEDRQLLPRGTIPTLPCYR